MASCPKRGPSTAIWEAKMRMQLAKRKGRRHIQVFLDVAQAYDGVDRDRTLLLLDGYGVGPNTLQYIKSVWEKLIFVPKQAGCYSDSFEVDCGVTQGDPDSPIIFNVIVDAVLRQWEIDMEEHGINIGDLYLGFYADDGLLAGENPEEIKFGLEKIDEMFGRMGLRLNDDKTKYMVSEGDIRSKLSNEAYDRMLKGRGRTYRERQKEKSKCQYCDKEITRAAMRKHCVDAHGREPERAPTEIEEEERGEFHTNMPGGRNKRGSRCPVPGCQYKAQDKYLMYRHFAYRHPLATIVIAGEGRLPKCELCGMHSKDVQKHQMTQECQKGRGRGERRTQIERARDNAAMQFRVNGRDIEKVTSFNYLGRILSERDDDTQCIETQLSKARQRWGMVLRVLKKNKVDNPKIMGRFYVAVVQAVLLYGAETWVVSERNMRKLKSFHHRCARAISGRNIRKLPDGSWITPRSRGTLREAGLWCVEKYIHRRKATLQKYAENRPILRACKETQPSSSNPNHLIWWG